MDNSDLLDETDPVRSAFAQVIGLPAWRVQKGHGSFLTFEFGTPHLAIREPIAEPSAQNPSLAKRLQRRRVVPCGEWHLWIYCCHWCCSESEIQQSTDQSTDDAITAAADLMDGQCLISVGVEPASGRTLFRFDLGGMLETWPYVDANEEQWFLYTPSKHVLSFRADGHYSWDSPIERPTGSIGCRCPD